MPPMPSFLRLLFLATIAALVVGAPCWYKAQQERHFRNFHVVSPGKLYRSGQLDLDGLKQVKRLYGIKTIVCLRAADTELSREEEKWARGQGVSYERIPPRPWWAADGSVPAAAGLQQFRAVMNNPANYPVLVHCFAGMHRTGAYCAVYRMDYEGWTNREALAEMRLLGYQTLEEDWDILAYLENYRPCGDTVTW
jgi:protein tyrosine/serine phosphatase